MSGGAGASAVLHPSPQVIRVGTPEQIELHRMLVRVFAQYSATDRVSKRTPAMLAV